MNSRFILLFVLLGILLTGCSPLVQSAQPSQTDLVALDAQHSIGQTFVARYDGLNGIRLFLDPQQTGDGVVTLHLRSDPQDDEDLKKAIMPLEQVTEAKVYRLDFPPLKNSNQKYYYATLEFEGASSLGVGSSSGSTYQDGAMYRNGVPQDGQLAFSLEYDPVQLIEGLAGELISWVGVLGLSILLFILPGWVVLGGLWQGWRELSVMGRVGLASGFNLAAYAVLLVITDRLGLHIGEWYAWGLIIFAIAGLAWQTHRKRQIQRKNQRNFSMSQSDTPVQPKRLAGITLVMILGMILVTRWWAVRSLEAPMWGDSVQHTVITQLIIDHGGLFKSWEPYAPYGSFGNQFGFPAAAALLAWVSGFDASQVVLWTGQVMNVLAVMALYPLAVRLAKGQPWAGVGAVLAAGLMSSMPAFYFNWGRYAQLAGQVILPAALWMLWDVVEMPAVRQHAGGLKAFDWRKIILAGVALGGMVMYQYRTPFFYLTFLMAWVLGWWLPAWGFNTQRWLGGVVKVGLVGLTGILVFLPWGLRILTTQVGDLAISEATRSAIWENIQVDYQNWRDIFVYLPVPVVGVALAGWLWSLLRREWLVFSLGLWAAWLASIYSWNLFGVPGAQQVSSFAVLIGLYIPGSLLFGWLVGQIGWTSNRWRAVEALLVLVVAGLGFWYAWEQRKIAEPQTYTMVTRPDTRAMEWIREETEPESLFLVEGFRAFYNTTAVGSDAGWWIPLLAGRDNTMPPLYALGSEVPLDSSYSTQIVQTVAALESVMLDSADGVKLLCDLGISHVYIGQLQGLVGLTWLNQLYTPMELLDQPAYQLRYQQDRVYIFELKPEVCER